MPQANAFDNRLEWVRTGKKREGGNFIVGTTLLELRYWKIEDFIPIS
jgi:hypothetical protein